MKISRQLSRQAIEEFKAIYYEEMKQDLSDDQAQEIAFRLLDLFKVLLEPTNSDKSE